MTTRGTEIPSLDGVRALAVLTVFVGHGATVGGWWPGHVGVTIFFFLSGFLIVTLLRREHERTGTLSMSKFYLRRLLRIQPPAFIAIGIAVGLGATGALAPPADGWGVLAGLFSYANYYIVVAGREGLPPEMSQLWSLGVEEHYYLVIPVLLLLMLRRFSRQTTAWVLLGVTALVPVWRVFLGLSGASFDRLYVSTDTRIDSLLVGSAMALLMNPAAGDPLIGGDRAERAMRWLPGLAVVIFALSAVVPSQAFRLSVADCVQYACLVPIFWFIISRPRSVAGRLLNHPAVAWIGTVSYAVYLLHRMVLALVEQVVAAGPLSDALALVSVLVAAGVMRLLVEDPLQQVRRRLQAPTPPRSHDT